MINEQVYLEEAKCGSIQAFHSLFKDFESSLRAYIYRMVTDPEDMEDILQDTFIKSFESIKSYREKSSLKTWVFSIATRLSIDLIKRRKRWRSDVLDEAKRIAGVRKDIRDYLEQLGRESEFDIREHIDFCFTCISKTLPIEQQVCLLLKDIYGFKVKEIARIAGKGEAAVKHYIRFARRTMNGVFDNRCAIVNKKGACHQCSQLSSWLSPAKHLSHQRAVRLELSQSNDRDKSLFELRENLVRSIDPLEAEGAKLHEGFMRLHRLAAGEIDEIL